MRTRSRLDFDWRFALGDFPGASAPDFDDRAWRRLDVPHDWSIEAAPHPDHPSGAAGGFFPGGVGWYRKRIEIPADLGERRVWIEFDGVYMNSEAWCNGRSLGVRPYGYSSFIYDLTPHVRPGERATIAVRVDNSRQKNCRWYSGSGIYRPVRLTIAGPICVAPWGVFVTTPEVSAERAAVAFSAELLNAECGMRNAESRIVAIATVLDSESKAVASEEMNVHLPGSSMNGAASSPDKSQARDITSPPSAFETFGIRHSAFGISHPKLWSPDAPHLYTLRIEIRRNGELLDRHDTRFGIRSIRFDPDEGFFLNGRALKFQGVNEHHDAGCLGAAVPDDALRRRLRILKEMGCNAIRTAHNPASPTLLDLCDEMGFLVVEEAFDEWKDGKTPYGYSQYWDEWWERDLTDMIRRDRNHPCIVLWSVGNEIKEVREGRPEGLPILRALREVCHREDPTRSMTCGCCNSRKTLAAGYGALMDVFGYNGGGGGCFDYEKDHAAYPKMPMFATEVPHTLQTRGVYRTRTWYRDLARNEGNVLWREPGEMPNAECRMPNGVNAERGTRTADCGMRNANKTLHPPLELMRVPDLAEEELFTKFDPHYQSSYDNALVRISARDSWRRTKNLPYFCGEFRWTGFDYLGECYAWPCKSWNFGVIDLCGFPKDTYYFYQSQWSARPMVHLLPHWTWPGLEGRTIPVICYTNCARVELFLNGRSLGVKERDDEEMRLRWDVVYEPGVLRAVGMPNGEWRMANDSNTERGTRKVEWGMARVECAQETAGEPAALRLRCEEAFLRADRTALAHIVVEVVDAQGRFVPYANPDIAVEVSGPTRLIGLENGDPLDTTPYQANHRRAFHGLMLAVVRSVGTPGKAEVTASAAALERARREIEVKAEVEEGNSGESKESENSIPSIASIQSKDGKLNE